MGLGVAAVASVVGVAACGKSEKKVEMDTLSAQKKGGWDVGDKGLRLSFPAASTQMKDSKGGSGSAYKDANALQAATRAGDTWRKYEMPTLFQSLEQQSLASQMKMMANGEMQKRYNQAAGLGSLLSSMANPEKTMLIFDMPGPVSVAAAAGVSEFAEPVFWFDNWPHPKGVVKSHETLGAAMFFAAELEENKGKRKGKVAPAIVLDSNRLNPYTSEKTQFDNRYAVTLPTGKELKGMGIESVMYVTATDKSKELDDINDYAVEYEKEGLKISMLALDAFQKDPEYKPEEGKKDPSRGYYYGGARHHHTHFFVYYPMFIYRPMYPMYMAPTASRAPARVRKPAYKPSARKTMFSGRKTGGAGGVGRRKPTGFGRVSTLQGKGGKILGTRSGSVGRFRSSSSFGG